MLPLTQSPEPVDFWSANAADWLSGVGTVAATIVALGFGISAFKTAQKDKKDREARARRDQARVYCWAGTYTPAFEKGGMAWVKNDTDLPIHNLAVNIFTDPIPNRKTFNLATSIMVPPGETRTIALDGTHFDRDLANPTVHIFVTFTDVDGFVWTRHPNGALTSFPWEDLQMPTPLDEGRPAPK